MKRILNYRGQEVHRTQTVSSILEARHTGHRLVQVTASSAEEAAAAETADIDMVVCLAESVEEVRDGSAHLFVTAAIDFGGAVSTDDLLGAALEALGAGADAVITARGMSSVRRLAEEDIPVVGHLGFVPKKSTLYGGVRAVGKTAGEAGRLWQQFKDLESAGAFAVECELIPARVMAEINRRTGMATISLGSGPDADVVFLFMSDICGESPRTPRHARSYGDLAALHEQIQEERISALAAFHEDVVARKFPDHRELAAIPDEEFERFLEKIDG